MRTDVPVLQRCCFCLPLRRGLIIWGYIKLILTAIALFYLAKVVYIILHVFYLTPALYITLSVIACLWVAEIIIHVVLVCGAHKKNVKYFRVYYYFSLTLLVVMILLALTLTGAMIIKYVTDYYYCDLEFEARHFIIIFSTNMFGNLVVQSYIILLVRSEIIKLNNVSGFRFVNNAAEAECHLQIETLVEDTKIPNTNQETANRIAIDLE